MVGKNKVVATGDHCQFRTATGRGHPEDPSGWDIWGPGIWPIEDPILNAAIRAPCSTIRGDVATVARGFPGPPPSSRERLCAPSLHASRAAPPRDASVVPAVRTGQRRRNDLPTQLRAPGVEAPNRYYTSLKPSKSTAQRRQSYGSRLSLR